MKKNKLIACVLSVAIVAGSFSVFPREFVFADENDETIEEPIEEVIPDDPDDATGDDGVTIEEVIDEDYDITGVAINETNFPDADFRSLISVYDSDLDGYLSSTERNSVTSFNSSALTFYTITDFKGIEFFPELQEFCYSGTPDCPQQFTRLDLSHNNKLQVVDVMYGNLSSLVLGDQPYLHFLFIQGNPIDQIDVSGCRYLVFANKLNSLGYECLKPFHAYNYDGEPTGHYYFLSLGIAISSPSSTEYLKYSRSGNPAFFNAMDAAGYSEQFYAELFDAATVNYCEYSDYYLKYVDFEFYDSCELYFEPDTMPPYSASIEMFRLYNPNSGEHFYTASESERNHLISLGWNDEGTGWIAPETSNTPVYRLYNPYGGEHHYTMSVAERDMLIRAGWNDEGIGWYSDDAQAVPLYRQYNPNQPANNHNYTTSLSENNWLVSIGWRAEGIGWYGIESDS